MSTGTYARVRSALAVNSVLLGFIAIYVSIVAVSFAAVWTTESRLPVQEGNLTSYWLESEVIGIAMYLAWVALPRPHRMRFALETVLPIGLGLYGVDAGGLTATLWFNLDAKTFQMPFGSLTGIGLILGGGFAGSFFGRYLGGLAATSRLRREAASSHRSAWFAETSPDGSTLPPATLSSPKQRSWLQPGARPGNARPPVLRYHPIGESPPAGRTRPLLST